MKYDICRHCGKPVRTIGDDEDIWAHIVKNPLVDDVRRQCTLTNALHQAGMAEPAEGCIVIERERHCMTKKLFARRNRWRFLQHLKDKRI